MVRVFFQNGNHTDVDAATKVNPVGFAGRGVPGFTCIDDAGTVVASFRLDQVVGYQI